MMIRQVLFAGSALGAVLAGPACAQDAAVAGTAPPPPADNPATPRGDQAASAVDDSSAQGLNGAGSEEIVVTAQRRSERLQDVPIAVTVLSGTALTTGGLTQNLDLGKVTPSVVTVQASGFYTPYIRGIGSRSITPGNESPVATYIDGVYQTDKQGLLVNGFNDVDSLQVLRGPQGTLFGRNATGGAILITTLGPSRTFTGSAEATGGSDEAGGRLFLAGPITSTISASIAGFYKREFGYIRNLNPDNGAGDKVGDTESYGVRGKIKWEPTDAFSALASFDYSDGRDTAPWAPQAIAGTGLTVGEGVALGNGLTIPDIRNQRPVYAGEVPAYIRGHGYGQTLTLSYDASAFSIKSITSHREDFSEGLLDLDATPLPIFYFQTDLKSNVWQQELTIGSTGDHPLSWIGGLYLLSYRDGYRNLQQNVAIPYPYSPDTFGSLPAGATHIAYHSYVTTKSLGLFGELTYKFDDRTALTLGARYTDETQTLDKNNNQVVSVPDGTGGILTLPPTLGTAVCAADPDCKGLSTSFRKPTWRAVLTHNFTPDVHGYLSYNRGFKSGVYNISTITGVIATRPESVDAYEAGIKSEFFDRRVTLNAAVYRNDYSNLQVPVTIPETNTQISLNAASARISGIEIEATLRPTTRITINGGFSTFFEAKYLSFPNCSVYTQAAVGNASAIGNCSNTRLAGTPTAANIRGEYRLPLAGGSSLSFNGLFSYQSSYDLAPYADAATRAPVEEPIYTINLSATWRNRNGVRVTAWGRNLADQQNVFRGIFTVPFGYLTTFARGATVGGTIGYDF